MKKIFIRKINEEAPVNNVGSGNIAGMGVGPQGEPGVKKSKYKRENEKTSMFRRPALEMKKGKFAGIDTFIVPNNIFERARMQKRKHGHWTKYLDEDSYGHAIREYANKNPYKPIIFEDEKTGVMVFARYGGEGERKRRIMKEGVNVELLHKAKKNRKLLRKPMKSKDSETVREITGNNGWKGKQDISGEKKKTLYKIMRQQKAISDFNVYHGTDSKLKDEIIAGTSTTLNPSIAKEFGKTVYKIRVPEGTPFVRIGGKWRGKHNGYSEDEIQLPAGKLSVKKKDHLSYKPEIKEEQEIPEPEKKEPEPAPKSFGRKVMDFAGDVTGVTDAADAIQHARKGNYMDAAKSAAPAAIKLGFTASGTASAVRGAMAAGSAMAGKSGLAAIGAATKSAAVKTGYNTLPNVSKRMGVAAAKGALIKSLTKNPENTK
jgi:hypothetical protein